MNSTDMGKGDNDYEKRRLTEKMYTRRKLHRIAEEETGELPRNKKIKKNKGDDVIRRSRRLIGKASFSKFVNTEETPIHLSASDEGYEDKNEESNESETDSSEGAHGDNRKGIKGRIRKKGDDSKTDTRFAIHKLESMKSKKMHTARNDKKKQETSDESSEASEVYKAKNKKLMKNKKRDEIVKGTMRKRVRKEDIIKRRHNKREYVDQSDEDESEGKDSRSSDIEDSEDEPSPIRGPHQKKREVMDKKMIYGRMKTLDDRDGRKRIKEAIVSSSDDHDDLIDEPEETEDSENTEYESSKDEEVDINVARRTKYQHDKQKVDVVKKFNTGLYGTKTKHKITDWKKLSYASDENEGDEEEEMYEDVPSESEDEEEDRRIRKKQKHKKSSANMLKKVPRKEPDRNHGVMKRQKNKGRGESSEDSDDEQIFSVSTNSLDTDDESGNEEEDTYDKGYKNTDVTDESENESDDTVDAHQRQKVKGTRKNAGKFSKHFVRKQIIKDSDESEYEHKSLYKRKPRRCREDLEKKNRKHHKKLRITRLGDETDEEYEEMKNENVKRKKSRLKLDESMEDYVEGNVVKKGKKSKAKDVVAGSDSKYIYPRKHKEMTTDTDSEYNESSEGTRRKQRMPAILKSRKVTEEKDKIKRKKVVKNEGELEKMKGRVMEKRKNEGVDKNKSKKHAYDKAEKVTAKDKKVFANLRIRSSPKPLVGAVRCLNDEQRQCVMDMGFGALLSFNIDELPSKLIYYVVDHFDEDNMQINLCNGCIKVTENSIHDMVGVPIGGTKLDDIKVPKTDEEIAEHWWAQFGSTKEVTPANIKKQIVVSTEVDMNFKLNFLALVVNTFGGCKIRGKIDMNVMKYVRKDTNFKAIDWSRYIWMMIKECKKLWRSSKLPMYFSGPATILLLLYVDGTRCTSIPVERLRPAFLSWNYDMMSYREEEEISCGGFGKLEILGDLHMTVQGGGVKKCDSEVHVELKENPITAQECLDNIEKVNDLIQKYKTKINEMVKEAAAKFPDDPTVVTWNKKYCMDNDIGDTDGYDKDYATPGKGKKTTDGSCEHMGLESCEEPNSQFWLSPTLEHTIASVEKSLMERSAGKDDNSEKVEGVRSDKSKTLDDVPSFSVGLTQENDGGKGNEIVVSGQLEPKPIKTWHPPSILDRAKRNLRLPATQKSPYTKRIVDICARLNVAEKKVWRMINDGVGDPNDIVFATVEGRESVRESVQTLARQEWITVDVIDSWAAMLSHDEEKRDKGSAHRFFCHTGMLREDMVQQSFEEQMQHFMSSFGEVANLDNNIMTLKNVDLVFFPILQSNHYYLICYNLRTACCHIIDNHYDMLSMEDKYKQIPSVLHGLFVTYLKTVGNAAAVTLEKIKPSRMRMRWRTISNSNDCGVFLMRHMECYMGESADKWECGFENEASKQNKQLATLRKKYTAKLLLSGHNLHAGMVMQQAVDHAGASTKR